MIATGQLGQDALSANAVSIYGDDRKDIEAVAFVGTTIMSQIHFNASGAMLSPSIPIGVISGSEVRATCSDRNKGCHLTLAPVARSEQIRTLRDRNYKLPRGLDGHGFMAGS